MTTTEKESAEIWAVIKGLREENKALREGFNALREDNKKILVSLGSVETLLCERCKSRGAEQKRQGDEINALIKKSDELAMTDATQQQSLSSVISTIKDTSSEFKLMAEAHAIALQKESERSANEDKLLDARLKKLEEFRKAAIGWGFGGMAVGSFCASLITWLIAWGSSISKVWTE